MPKSLITAMPTFDEKSEKIELFEDFFQTSVKILHQLTKDHRINYFHSLIMGVALQTFKSINGPTTKNLGKFLAFFRRKCLKLEPMTTMKHKFQTFDFHLAKQKLVDFLDEYDNLAKEAIVIAAPCRHRTTHICQNATTPEKIKKSGSLGEWQVWPDYHTPRDRERFRAEWFGSNWLATNKRCEPTWNKHQGRHTQTNVPSL